MRLFKFLAVFLVVIGLVYVLILGFNFRVFKTVFTNQEALAEGSEWVEKTFSLAGLVDFMQAHPQFVSVYIRDNEPDSAIWPDIEYQILEERSQASLQSFALLVTYAERVSEGSLDPDLIIELDAIERFVVPGFEPNRHRESLRLLRDRSEVSSNRIRLSDLVEIVVLRNHQPGSDLLYTILGKESVYAVLEKYTQGAMEDPILWSAFHLATVAAGGSSQTDAVSPDFAQMYQFYEHRFFNDDRTSAPDILKSLGINKLDYTFFEEKNAYLKLPKVSPYVLNHFVSKVWDTEFTDERVLGIVKKFMGWPMQDSRMMRDFDELYALFDSRISLAHGIVVGTSSYTQRTHISTVFFDQLPIGFWMHMTSNLINQDFQNRSLYDPALYERTLEMLGVHTENEDGSEPEKERSVDQLHSMVH